MTTSPPYGPGEFRSWGRIGDKRHDVAVPVYRDQLGGLVRSGAVATLPVGLGRSYGDSCLNQGGRLISMSALDRVIAFDATSGRLHAEAGLSLDQLLRLIVPQGWFTATSPGTRFVTLGGAVANDIHGKNHHTAGSFGCSVRSFGLVRSNADPMRIDATAGADVFAATIGGMGLTGVIETVEIDLSPIRSAYLDVERVAFRDLGEFFALTASSESFEHTVAWIDCANGGRPGRGIFQRANWCADGDLQPHETTGPRVPFDFPNKALNGATVRLFNALYYRLQKSGESRKRVHYAPFFYPLDSLREWNRIYGARGFYQYQCAIPLASAQGAVSEMLQLISRAGAGSFLAVLKTLGPRRSPGILSFAREGATLALDFPNRGARTLKLLGELDEVVARAGGWLYPAKDGRMTAQMFQASYPDWKKFATFVDPTLSSDFWRRASAAA